MHETATGGNQAPRASFKGVCYKCSFKDFVTGSTCPQCSFPLILEIYSRDVDDEGLADLLQRPSLREGAPLLPGVDAEPRQAQLLAEARRLRHQALAKVTRTKKEPTVVERASRQIQAVTILLVCFSAVAAGVLAAVINRSL